MSGTVIVVAAARQFRTWVDRWGIRAKNVQFVRIGKSNPEMATGYPLENTYYIILDEDQAPEEVMDNLYPYKPITKEKFESKFKKVRVTPAPS